MQLEAQLYLSEKDAHLKRIIDTVAEPSIISTRNVFHDLMSCIIEQQIHYRSTKKIFQRLLEKAEIEFLTLENFAVFDEQAISTIKISMSKYETLLRIVEFWENGIIKWNNLSDEEVVEKLSSIKGVGSWSIQMILLYTLERPNIFPTDDFHLKQIMTDWYSLNPKVKLKAQMTEIASLWAPNQSLAVLYMFAWKDYLKKSKKQ
jgi:DNA-3-methyladenine glycosylase II